MRKIILMALAGFLWKKYQARGDKQSYSTEPVGRS
jgi:hypothetical protein